MKIKQCGNISVFVAIWGEKEKGRYGNKKLLLENKKMKLFSILSKR